MPDSQSVSKGHNHSTTFLGIRFPISFLILLKCVCFTIWLSNPNYQLI